MAKMAYEWGSVRHSVPAQVVGEAVAAIQRRDGVCRPDALVETARDEASPLHPLFTWDDCAAADRWRRHEARNVINELRVTVVGYAEPVPAFVSIRTTDKHDEPLAGYRAFGLVKRDADLTAQAVTDALRQLNGLRRRYAALQQLAGVWEAVEAVEAAQQPQAAAAD